MFQEPKEVKKETKEEDFQEMTTRRKLNQGQQKNIWT